MSFELKVCFLKGVEVEVEVEGVLFEVRGGGGG